MRLQYRPNYLDGDVFNNTLWHLGTSQVAAILRCRAESPANIDDSAFVPLVDAMLRPFEEFLPPEQIQKLWDFVNLMNYELRKGGEPGLTYKQREEQFQRCRQKPRQVVPESRNAGKAKKNRRRREGMIVMPEPRPSDCERTGHERISILRVSGD